MDLAGQRAIPVVGEDNIRIAMAHTGIAGTGIPCISAAADLENG